MFIPRGLRHHRYIRVALRAFFIRKDEVLVVQAQEEVDQEVTIAMSPYGLSNIEKRRRVCFPFFFKCITFRCQLVPFFIAIYKLYNVSNVLLLLSKKKRWLAFYILSYCYKPLLVNCLCLVKPFPKVDR